jgi:hypothetical protein
VAKIVTIEGSTSPCSELPRGEQRTVVYSDRVKGLVSKGFVVVVDGPHESHVSAELHPNIAKGTGEPNVGHEVPADGNWHELVSEGTGEPLPPIQQADDEHPAVPGPIVQFNQHDVAGEAAESALHDHSPEPEPESIGEGVLGLTLPGS